MTGFIARLEDWAINNTKMKAVLRRSLAFGPGMDPSSYRYVEPFLKSDESTWHRQMYYLVAGLWAFHWRLNRSKTKISIAKACANYMRRTGSGSTEQRFISVIDADTSQLPYRLRQLVALLKEEPIDFVELLKDLLRWNNEDKIIQNKWARNFYRSSFEIEETSL